MKRTNGEEKMEENNKNRNGKRWEWKGTGKRSEGGK